MKLKYARLIELFVRFTIMILTSPIWLIGTIGTWLSTFNDFFLDIVDPLLNKFGRWLLRYTKEAKEGEFGEACLYGDGIYNTLYAYKDLKEKRENEKHER